MTPAEFYVIAESRIEMRNEEWKFRDILNGVQCSLLANINRSSSSRVFTAEDFRVMRENKKQDPEELVRTMDTLAAASRRERHG